MLDVYKESSKRERIRPRGLISKSNNARHASGPGTLAGPSVT